MLTNSLKSDMFTVAALFIVASLFPALSRLNCLVNCLEPGTKMTFGMTCLQNGNYTFFYFIYFFLFYFIFIFIFLFYFIYFFATLSEIILKTHSA